MKLIQSFGYACNGLRHSFITQRNFRIHVVFLLLALSLAVVLHITEMEWLLLLFCMGLVLFAELLNTAIEKLCDVVEPQQHPGIKLVKDIAAAAVLVSAIGSFCIGAVIFLPKIFLIIKSL